MTEEKWEKIIDQIDVNFGIEEKKTEKREGGEEAEIVIFKGPLGKMKLERISRPKVLDKKVYHSKRIGGRVKEEYIYSDTERTIQLKAYKWDEGQNDWLEIEAEKLDF